MKNKSSATLVAAVGAVPARRPLLAACRLVAGLAAFVVICLAASLLALPIYLSLPRSPRIRIGRKLASCTARVLLGVLERIGACRFDLSALDALRDAPAMILAPNHPSLLDAVMILSRLPAATCIVKSALFNNLIFGMIARIAAYIPNTPLRGMVHRADDDLRGGSHVLLFPEGTRTTRFPLDPVQGTVGMIAKKAGVPVQTLLIESDSRFLGKGWPLLRTPQMPVRYRIRLGRRFDPPARTAQFAGVLEEYFLAELAHLSGSALSDTGSMP